MKFEIRTLADLSAFRIKWESAVKCGKDCEKALTAGIATLAENPTSDAAPAFGVALGNGVMQIFEDHVKALEPVALHFLGERRIEGETGFEYMARLSTCCETELSIRTTMANNGLMLTLT